MVKHFGGLILGCIKASVALQHAVQSVNGCIRYATFPESANIHEFCNFGLRGCQILSKVLQAFRVLRGISGFPAVPGAAPQKASTSSGVRVKIQIEME